MKICTNCGYEGKPIRQKAGAFGVMFFVLIFVMTWSFASQLFWITLPLALASIVLFVYWFFTTKCPKCKNISMVRKNSHAGQEYLKNPHTETSNVVFTTRDPKAEIYITEK
ncbi:MAG TPA: hypothetical protein ENK06_03195 [Gammaproteobacteria bacterium]|nr:hypothetical protein [Gammaproteobacteria bacterium]